MKKTKNIQGTSPNINNLTTTLTNTNTVNAIILYSKLGKSTKTHYGLCVTNNDIEHILTFTIHPSDDDSHVTFTKEECNYIINNTKVSDIGNFVFSNLASMNKSDRTTYLRLLKLDECIDDINYAKLPIFKCDETLASKVTLLLNKELLT